MLRLEINSLGVMVAHYKQLILTFSWLNGSLTEMLLSSQNYLGLNTTSTTAMLDVNGNVALPKLPKKIKIPVSQVFLV